MGRSQTAGFAAAILGVSIASLLVPLPNLNRSIWLTKLFDLGHVPLFAVATICLWRIGGRKVWLAFGLASLLSVVTEIAQLFIDPRHARRLDRRPRSADCVALFPLAANYHSCGVGLGVGCLADLGLRPGPN